MNITYRKANKEDFEAILSLINELASYEKAKHKVTNSVSKMKEESAYFDCFIAENEENKIIGIALTFTAYSTWVGRYLFLEDLIVNENYRGNKIGSNLIAKVFELAKEQKVERVRWQVLNWNKPAIEFYKKINATIDKEWYNCDFNKEQIDDFKQM